MDERLKQRLIGAAVVISLGVIFLPMILDGGRHTEFEKIRIEIPQRPEVDYSSAIAPLTPPEISVTRIEESPTGPDEIDLEGSKPIIDAELEAMIKPIEEPDEVVSKQGVDLRKPDAGEKPAAIEPKPVSRPAEKPVVEKTEPVSKPAKKPDAVEEKTAVASIPVTSPSVVSAWVVQVGSFSSRSSAIGLRDKLRKQGFAAFVESFDASGKPSHRVRIGPETARSRSEKTLAELKKKMKLDGIVVTYP
jgi:DedD protein